MSAARRTALYALLAMQPLLWLVPALRHAFESRMVLHMFAQFPSLLAGGWALVCLGKLRWSASMVGVHGLDKNGFVGGVALTCVCAFWTIPAALDLALLAPAVAAAKYASWMIAGAALAAGWPRLATVPRIFLIGNLVWMFATAGLLYQTAEQRLCVSYLVDEQLWAGRLMLCLAGLLTACAVVALWQGSARTGIRRVRQG